MKNISLVSTMLAEISENKLFFDDLKARYHQLVSSSIYVPPSGFIRKIRKDNFTDGTRVFGCTRIETFDNQGNEGIPVDVIECAILLSTSQPKRDLVQIPLHHFTLHCENGIIDFEARESLELEPHTFELTFETLEHADKISELALTEGGANFLLTFETGHIEVIIVEAQHG
jgi:hypothetical protein